MDSSASTLNQGVSKARYIFLEADGLGSSECVWVQAMEYLAGADALYAGSSSWPFFVDIRCETSSGTLGVARPDLVCLHLGRIRLQQC